MIKLIYTNEGIILYHLICCYRLYEANGTVSSQSFSLVDGFLGQLNDRFFTKTFLDNVLRGLTNEPLKQVGPSFATSVHSQLFGYSLHRPTYEFIKN